MAEIGQVISEVSEKVFAEELVIRPPVGQQWMIPNLYHGGACALIKTDGVNEVTAHTDTENGAWLNFKFFLTNDSYLVLRSVANEDTQQPITLAFEGVRIV